MKITAHLTKARVMNSTDRGINRFNCTVKDSLPLQGLTYDALYEKAHAPKPVVNNAASEQYDRDAYLAILSLETRERLLTIRGPK